MSSTSNEGGVGLGLVVFVVFLILKLTHLIDWSWWWVTCPLWLVWGLLLAIVVIGLIGTGIGAGIHWLINKFPKVFNFFDSL